MNLLESSSICLKSPETSGIRLFKAATVHQIGVRLARCDKLAVMPVDGVKTPLLEFVGSSFLVVPVVEAGTPSRRYAGVGCRQYVLRYRTGCARPIGQVALYRVAYVYEYRRQRPVRVG